MSRDPGTYGSIANRYDAWIESEARGPVRPRLRRSPDDDFSYSPAYQGNPDMTRTVHAAIGIGLGLALLALAVIAFSRASYWASFARSGAQVGFTLIGIFLSIAGVGGIIATWNHNFRVAVGRGGGAH